MAPANVFYWFFRAVVRLVLRLFFRLGAVEDPGGGLQKPGAVIFVGNHPNGLVDPAIVFALAHRQVTFLAKAPLFRIPVLAWILKGLGALPVYRRQDGDDTAKNEGVLAASVEALVQGRTISLFPEGRSHSEPHLAELKTGCARIALEAARRGVSVQVVPVGLTYAEKNRFRSSVQVRVGSALLASGFLHPSGQGDGEFDAARRFTGAIADALREVTLNLEAWEDLPIVETAEALFALEQGDSAGDPDRIRAFARGMALVRAEQPARFERLKSELAAFRRRLGLVDVTPGELRYRYRTATVVRFLVRNLVWLLGLPVVLVGMVVFAIPYWIPSLLVRAFGVPVDLQSTVKVLTSMVLAPGWWILITAAALRVGGLGAAALAFLATPWVALFTRYFYERRRAALRDARVFLVFWSRRRLKTRLLAEGGALAQEIERLASEYRGRVVRAQVHPPEAVSER